MSNQQATAKKTERMKNESAVVTANHAVVSHEKWLTARTSFLAKEKDLTMLRDELSRQRRELPWELVDKNYIFDGPNGKQSLTELFDGRSQLIVYHFMYDPSWDAGCPHCSFWADNFNGIIMHLNHRDVTMIAVSHATYGKLAAYEKRMGWNFKWVSSFGTDFNFDYHVSFTPEEVANKKAFYNYATQDPGGTEHAGYSAFYKDSTGTVFHTYSAYSRGIDIVNTAYNYLDLAPKGRDEGSRNQYWVRRHDEYGK
jgi:predicted dithiol-disulfide oxidoreductase (DUF899 family)